MTKMLMKAHTHKHTQPKYGFISKTIMQYHFHPYCQKFKCQTIPNVGKNTGTSRISGGIVNWYDHFRMHMAIPNKIWKCTPL